MTSRVLTIFEGGRQDCYQQIGQYLTSSFVSVFGEHVYRAIPSDQKSSISTTHYINVVSPIPSTTLKVIVVAIAIIFLPLGLTALASFAIGAVMIKFSKTHKAMSEDRIQAVYQQKVLNSSNNAKTLQEAIKAAALILRHDIEKQPDSLTKVQLESFIEAIEEFDVVNGGRSNFTQELNIMRLNYLSRTRIDLLSESGALRGVADALSQPQVIPEEDFSDLPIMRKELKILIAQTLGLLKETEDFENAAAIALLENFDIREGSLEDLHFKLGELLKGNSESKATFNSEEIISELKASLDPLEKTSELKASLDPLVRFLSDRL